MPRKLFKISTDLGFGVNEVESTVMAALSRLNCLAVMLDTSLLQESVRVMLVHKCVDMGNHSYRDERCMFFGSLKVMGRQPLSVSPPVLPRTPFLLSSL